MRRIVFLLFLVPLIQAECEVLLGETYPEFYKCKASIDGNFDMAYCISEGQKAMLTNGYKGIYSGKIEDYKSGEAVQTFLRVNGTIVECLPRISLCFDSDNSKYTKGYVDYDGIYEDRCEKAISNKTQDTDECSEGCYVRENLCDVSGHWQRIIRCEYGCVDGACTKPDVDLTITSADAALQDDRLYIQTTIMNTGTMDVRPRYEPKKLPITVIINNEMEGDYIYDEIGSGEQINHTYVTEAPSMIMNKIELIIDLDPDYTYLENGYVDEIDENNNNYEFDFVLKNLCSDTDGGRKYNKKGILDVMINGTLYAYIDSCKDDILEEWYCVNDTAYSEKVGCAVCHRGACEVLESECSLGLDPDNDGLDNHDECRYGTNLYDPDTDGDHYNDNEEINEGTDPVDPKDYPQGVIMDILIWIYNDIVNDLSIIRGIL